MKVYFYLPAQYLPTPELARQWQDGTLRLLPAGGRIACSQGWIYQTWVQLREIADVELTSSFPEAGVIVAMSNSLHTHFRANAEQFVIAVNADFEPHPGAQLQIVQNRATQLPHSQFLPHWPQPGLIPRDPARGDRFENLAFFGAPENLAPGIAEAQWPGLKLHTPPPEQWHDFSEVDAIIGIRDFDRATHPRKPATKLYNAWLAGTIFIGGNDSAPQAERKSALDFLEANSLPELTTLLQRLQENPQWRLDLMKAAAQRGTEFSHSATRETWRHFLETELPPRVAAWQQLSAPRKAWFWLTQQIRLAIRRRLPG